MLKWIATRCGDILIRIEIPVSLEQQRPHDNGSLDVMRYDSVAQSRDMLEIPKHLASELIVAEHRTVDLKPGHRLDYLRARREPQRKAGGDPVAVLQPWPRSKYWALNGLPGHHSVIDISPEFRRTDDIMGSVTDGTTDPPVALSVVLALDFPLATEENLVHHRQILDASGDRGKWWRRGRAQ